MGLKNRNFTDDEFIKAVQESFSKADVLRKLYLVPAGANYRMINILMKKLNLNSKHFTGKSHLKGKSHNWGLKQPMKKILVKESSYTSSHRLKLRLIKEEYFEAICQICSLKDWQGKEISLHLDHINGINTDNRISNLRLLCPNCHSQTETYCGKNKSKLQ